MEEVGSGIAASLAGVDCVALGTTQAAFGRLFGTGGALIPALTALLTLYVGFFALQLLTGRSSVGVNALTPRMMTIGLVLTFATSWSPTARSYGTSLSARRTKSLRFSPARADRPPWCSRKR